MYTLNYSTYIKLKNWKEVFVESEVNAMATFGCLVPGLSTRVSSECWYYSIFKFSVHLISPVIQSCLTLCDPMDCSTPGLPVHHQLLELVQTHVHQVCDALQPSHPLLFTYMGCHSLLQGIFPTQGSNPGLLYYRQILYHLSYQGSPYKNTSQSTLNIFAHSMFLTSVEIFNKNKGKTWSWFHLLCLLDHHSFGPTHSGTPKKYYYLNVSFLSLLNQFQMLNSLTSLKSQCHLSAIPLTTLFNDSAFSHCTRSHFLSNYFLQITLTH